MPDQPPRPRRFRKRYALLALLLLLVVFALGPRASSREPDVAAVARAVPTDLRALAAWVAQRERAAGVTDTFVAATLTFAGDTARTPYAVVYLHGFSGTRQESSPVAARVAQALGANLFEVRLTGHGLPSDSMKRATAEAWMADAARALTIGARLGDSVVVIGLSTGGTLASWVTAIGDSALVRPHTVALVSPNFGPQDRMARALLLPWMPTLLPRAMPAITLDDTANLTDERRRMATHRIPIEATFPMQALVDRVQHMPLRGYTVPTIALWNLDDPIVKSDAIATWMRALETRGAPVARVTLVPAAGENPHVLAGRILSPGKVDTVVTRIVGFVRARR
jgi:esterase/lipase